MVCTNCNNDYNSVMVCIIKKRGQLISTVCNIYDNPIGNFHDYRDEFVWNKGHRIFGSDFICNFNFYLTRVGQKSSWI